MGVFELSVRDLSVPAHRTIGATELFGIGETSSAVLPYWEFQVLAPLLGCAEGAYHNYTSSTRKRVGGTTNAAVARFTQVQQRLAEVSARIKSARLLYEESMHLLMSRRVEGKVLTREEALELARDRSFIAGALSNGYTGSRQTDGRDRYCRVQSCSAAIPRHSRHGHLSHNQSAPQHGRVRQARTWHSIT